MRTLNTFIRGCVKVGAVQSAYQAYLQFSSRNATLSSNRKTTSSSSSQVHKKPRYAQNQNKSLEDEEGDDDDDDGEEEDHGVVAEEGQAVCHNYHSPIHRLFDQLNIHSPSHPLHQSSFNLLGNARACGRVIMPKPDDSRSFDDCNVRYSCQYHHSYPFLSSLSSSPLVPILIFSSTTTGLLLQ